MSNISGIGIVRVPSGMRTSTRLPSSAIWARPSSVSVRASASGRNPWANPFPTICATGIVFIVSDDGEVVAGYEKELADIVAELNRAATGSREPRHDSAASLASLDQVLIQ